jgi:sigma-E factor negative regulatory protein RseB
MIQAATRCGAAVGLICVLSGAHAQDARAWLDRMNEAIEALNYRGTFVHVHDGNAETMHVVHRSLDGVVSERLVSLDGVGREIIRREQNIQCILPDRKVVLLEERRDASPLVSALPNYSEHLETHYQFKIYSTDRVANRQTQVIGISPRDEFRYGYVLWLDQDTAMPLKSRLWGENKVVVEEILFTSIEFPDEISDSELQAATATEGYTMFRSPQPPTELAAGIPWHVGQLPAGFELMASTLKPIAGSEYPVEHMVFSDGLATVSVFIEDPKTEADVTEGFSAVGSTNTFSLTFNGRKVTAVGEVPRRTVETIATSLEAR